MDLERRLASLENRVTREFKHLNNVMGTQREIVQKAFDQVNLALLEQQMTVSSAGERVVADLREFASVQVAQAAEIEEIKRRLDRLENPPAA